MADPAQRDHRGDGPQAQADGSHPAEPAQRAGAAQPDRPRLTPSLIETWVDQAIQQAQRRGDFDDLKGAGKPLANLESGDDPDWWVKGLIEREKLDMSAAMPTTMALRRERESFPASLIHLGQESQVRERLEDFNSRVLTDRRRPWAGPGSPPIVGRVDVDEMLAAWRAARARQTEQELARRSERSRQTDDGGPPRSRRRWWRR